MVSLLAQLAAQEQEIAQGWQPILDEMRKKANRLQLSANPFDWHEATGWNDAADYLEHALPPPPTGAQPD